MATKFYLRNTAQTTPISPTIDAAWETSVSLVRALANVAKTSDTITTVNVTEATSTQKDIAIRQYITPLPKGQVITGAQAIKFQCRVSETGANNNMFSALGIRVIASDGTTVRKTVLAVTIDNVESATTLTNRQFTATSAATNYTAVDGDYLVIEIGMSGDPSGSNPHDFAMSLGDSSATDLAEDDTTTTANNPWVSLNDTLTTGTSSAAGSSAGTGAATGTGRSTFAGVGSSAGIAIAGPGGSVTADFYDGGGPIFGYYLSVPISGSTEVAQSFTAVDGLLTSARFQLKQYGSPTGNVVAKLYAHSGSFGSTSLPTGAALATSDNVDATTLPTPVTDWVTFSFSGANQIRLSPNQYYCIAVAFTNGDASNAVAVDDNQPGTHSGNESSFSNPNWLSGSGDLLFYVIQNENENGRSIAASVGASTGAGTATGVGTAVNGSVGGSVVDSYLTEPLTGSVLFAAFCTGTGQGFTAVSDSAIKKARFYLYKEGSPTGNVVAKIYAHSGTYGTSGIPTGSALGTSDPVDAATLGTGFFSNLVEFVFSTPVFIAAGQYFVTVEFLGGDGSNKVDFAVDTSGTHAGNRASIFTPNGWTSGSWDLIFELQSASGFAVVAGVGDAIGSGSIGASDGVSTATAVGASTAASVGASAGTATATAVGTGIDAGIGASDGVSTATGVGASTAASVGASTGAGAATGIGISTAASVGASDGVSTATAVGASTAASVGASVGAGAATGVSTSIAASVGASAGAGTATGVGTGVNESVGASAGVSTATGVGASTAASVGASDGVSTATGVGISTAASVGASAGAGTATGVSTSIAASVGASDGVSTATAVGASTAASVGASDGVSTATAVGASTAASVGASAGVSTATGVGISTAASVGASAGAGTATGVGTGVNESVGASDGVSTATAVGASTVAGVGASAGTSTAAGISTTESFGLSVGTSVALGVGASINAGVGASDGVSTATAVGISTAASVGASDGVSTATAVGASTAASVGASAGVSTATAVGVSINAGVGASDGVSTATAVGASTAASVGASAGAGTATGIGAGFNAGIGASSGISTATGVGISTTASVGASSGISTATGVGISTTASVGASSGAGAAISVGTGIDESFGASDGAGAAISVGSAVMPGVGIVNGTAVSDAVGASVFSAIGLADGSSFVFGVPLLDEGVGSSAGAATVNGISRARFTGRWAEWRSLGNVVLKTTESASVSISSSHNASITIGKSEANISLGNKDQKAIQIEGVDNANI